MDNPLALPYVTYEASRDQPNIVVDGAANESTVLALSHWPGTIQPPGLADDLSAQMAFHYLERGPEHPPAACVTNNHYDQDGLVSIYALAHPQDALELREILIDVAAAGDFGTYRDRAAARASMTIAAYADPLRSPLANDLAGLSYDQQCAILYEQTLPLLVPMATTPERFRDLWGEEDDRLTATERALATGQIQITEHADIDLAVVTVADGVALGGGHRFAHHQIDELHPFGVNNATDRHRMLIVSGRRYRYLDRYETWVQYCSRPTLARVDLEPLAHRLSDMERDATTWNADPPSVIMPAMSPSTESTLDPSEVIGAVIDHLTTAPPAWDPTAPR